MTADEFAEFVAVSRWQFAKTMPRNPHAYTLRKWHEKDVFEAACDFVVAESREVMFGRQAYRIHELGPFRYWTMGEPTADTELLNRTFRQGVETDELLDTDGAHAKLAPPVRPAASRPLADVRELVTAHTDGIPTFTSARE